VTLAANNVADHSSFPDLSAGPTITFLDTSFYRYKQLSLFIVFIKISLEDVLTA